MRYLIIVILLLSGCSEAPTEVASEPKERCSTTPGETRVLGKLLDLEVCTLGKHKKYIYYHKKIPVMGIITEMKDGKEVMIAGFKNEKYIAAMEEKLI